MGRSLAGGAVSIADRRSARGPMPAAPVGRPLEGAAPQARAFVARGVLLGEVAAAAAHVAHRVALAHQRAADIGDVAGRADGERAAVAVGPLRRAGDRPVRDQRLKPRRGGQAAGPALALGVAAGLRLLRRVDADEADAPVAGMQRVAVDDADGGERGGRRRGFAGRGGAEDLRAVDGEDDEGADDQRRQRQRAAAPPGRRRGKARRAGPARIG